MIEAYYNFKKSPFSKDIAPSDIFACPAVNELQHRLNYIKEKRGIMLLTGAPGSGKTAQLRAFVAKLNENLYKSFYLPLSTVNILDFYRQLCSKLGGAVFYRKTQLFSSIQHTIRDYVENAKKIPIIIFDEAHFLINENFYELQIITNFHMDSVDPAVFILSGQPHIRERLLRPIHQSFNQRIHLKFHLSPLSKEESIAYIEHHLNLAGARESIFNQNALSALFQVSAGIPRIINALAKKTLEIGAREKKSYLSEDEVYRASKEL